MVKDLDKFDMIFQAFEYERGQPFIKYLILVYEWVSK